MNPVIEAMIKYTPISVAVGDIPEEAKKDTNYGLAILIVGALAIAESAIDFGAEALKAEEGLPKLLAGFSGIALADRFATVASVLSTLLVEEGASRDEFLGVIEAFSQKAADRFREDPEIWERFTEGREEV